MQLEADASSEQFWRDTFTPARFWEPQQDGATRCTLCPRQCIRKDGQTGFCGVRRNQNGSLVTLNYGKSVPMTVESVETEAVFHYAPGEKILSLGNIGCMLDCDFCQNWSTSQAKYVRDSNIEIYSPDDVVQYALQHNIRILSWTYNDPVVWQEFVVDTARLAKKHNIRNLYKSAFYIGEKAIEELLPVIDIFSISLKSMDADFYRDATKGALAPVLDGIKQVYAACKKNANLHLEISNLCITGRNDTLEHSMAVVNWMQDNLDSSVPLHYVRFHPDYKYTHVERTSIPFLESARQQAISAGMKYVYVGNVHGTDGAHTYCPDCGNVVVHRYGLVVSSYLVNNKCAQCGCAIPVKQPLTATAEHTPEVRIPDNLHSHDHIFRGPIKSCHVEQPENSEVYYQFLSSSGTALGKAERSSCRRFMLSSPFPEAEAVRFFYSGENVLKYFEVYDRAHFPVLQTYQTCCGNEDTPPSPFDSK